MLATLSACRAEPKVTIDLRLLDRVPVVPLHIAEGVDEQSSRHTATGLLQSDGTILTCSHALPRNRNEGRIRITGPWITYHVQSSGDDLSFDFPRWSETDPPSALNDWAVITTDPPIDAKTLFFSPLSVAISTTPPEIGETVYLVGYTVETTASNPNGQFVRYWVPMIVVTPPSHIREALGNTVLWLRPPSNATLLSPPQAEQSATAPSTHSELNTGTGHLLHSLRNGFSGAPVLRVQRNPNDTLTTPPKLEVCAVFHGMGNNGHDTIGVAIVPKFFATRK